MEDMDIGCKIPSCITFTIVKKVLMMMVEMEIGIRPAPLPTIIQVGSVDHSVYLFMVLIEVDICLRPTTFFHITMVDYILSTQGSLKKRFV